jgi:hypothetical protein
MQLHILDNIPDKGHLTRISRHVLYLYMYIYTGPIAINMEAFMTMVIIKIQITTIPMKKIVYHIKIRIWRIIR